MGVSPGQGTDLSSVEKKINKKERPRRGTLKQQVALGTALTLTSPPQGCFSDGKPFTTVSPQRVSTLEGALAIGGLPYLM